MKPGRVKTVRVAAVAVVVAAATAVAAAMVGVAATAAVAAATAAVAAVDTVAADAAAGSARAIKSWQKTRGCSDEQPLSVDGEHPAGAGASTAGMAGAERPVQAPIARPPSAPQSLASGEFLAEKAWCGGKFLEELDRLDRRPPDEHDMAAIGHLRQVCPVDLPFHHREKIRELSGIA